MKTESLNSEWDLIVMGGGPGGYVAAMDAADEGLSVLLIEKEHMGGICLNEGCVPTKTMLHSAHQYESISASHTPAVSAGTVQWDQKALLEWKNKVVGRFRKGVESLMKMHKVTVLAGTASFAGPHTIEVDSTRYEGRNIIIATGAVSARPPVEGINLPHVVNSREFLELDQIPSSITVVGGGVIGLEIASLCAALGKDVHIVEMQDCLMGGNAPELAEILIKNLKNCHFHFGTAVRKITESTVTCEKEGKSVEIPSEAVLFSTGRLANTADLNLKAAGIAVSKKGIAVSDRMQSSVPGVYAIGDVTGLAQYAHAASRMAEVAVANICGKTSWYDPHVIPWVVYTSPEAGGCGLTAREAEQEGYDPVSGQFRLVNTARFFAENGNAPGWVSLVADRDTRQILGMQMLGTGCSEMIFGGALMVQNEMTIDDLTATVFPHPSVSEAIRECGLILKKTLDKG